MILMLYGAPRSGKSCYAVKYIVDSTDLSPADFLNAKKFGASPDFFKGHLKKYDEIYHNIEGLGVFEDITGNETQCLLHDWGSEPHAKRLLVVDECHRFLEKPSTELTHFFAYHGHYGFDIILITQSPYLINRKISVLAEIEYTAVRRSLRLKDELRYSVGVGGERTSYDVVPRPSQYFALYRSATIHKKHKSQVHKFVYVLFGLAVCLVGLVSLFLYLFTSRASDASSSLASATALKGGSPPRTSGGEPPLVPGVVPVPAPPSFVPADQVTIWNGEQMVEMILTREGFYPSKQALKMGIVRRYGRTYLIDATYKHNGGQDNGIDDHRGDIGQR